MCVWGGGGGGGGVCVCVCVWVCVGVCVCVCVCVRARVCVLHDVTAATVIFKAKMVVRHSYMLTYIVFTSCEHYVCEHVRMPDHHIGFKNAIMIMTDLIS